MVHLENSIQLQPEVLGVAENSRCLSDAVNEARKVSLYQWRTKGGFNPPYAWPLKPCILYPRLQFLLYADDLKLYVTVNSDSDCDHLQCDLDALSEFHKCNDHFLNELKCKCVSFLKKNEKYFQRLLNAWGYYRQID